MITDAMDRRVRKTRRQLRDCLITLLRKKKVQDITVRELTEMADLNRGTFYLHYKDVFDLLEKVEGALLEEFNQLVQNQSAKALKEDLSGIFLNMYQLVQDNSDLVEILLGENGDLHFVNRLKDLIRDKCLKDWREIFHRSDPILFEAFFSFILSGCVGLVQHWLATGMKETPEQMSYLTEQFITNGIRILDRDTWPNP